MGQIQDKVALITGGGRGIGRATAILFAQEGAKVVIANRNEGQGNEVVKAITDAGGQASFIKTDIAIASDVESAVRHTVDTFGRLDIAFNNSGVEGELSPTTDATEDNFDFVYNVNVKGVWLSMKYEIPQMLAQGEGGAIVNCSSIAGVIGFPGLGHYVASKHAVMGLTKTAALEYAEAGIRINAVNPAAIDTSMADRLVEKTGMGESDLVSFHPVGRVGTPEEIAHAVLYLCSDGAKFTTGTSLLVDGGFTAR
ncbi:MAG: SDR family oxidoreductase [Phycisphaerales bacterium JB043]